MTKITKQKGSSSSTPSALSRWVTSKVMNYLNRDEYLVRKRIKNEKCRRKEGRRHVIEYFHQVDDGYSHLAIKTLGKLREKYDVDIIVHLVPPVKNDDFPEIKLWQEMSLRDAVAIAPYYGLEFKKTESLPSKKMVELANSILCQLKVNEFESIGVSVSNSLWENDEEGLIQLAKKHGAASTDAVALAFESGLSRRSTLKHYNTAMFYYEGEWYWGVDRLYHLENRLISLGVCRKAPDRLVAPRPDIDDTFSKSEIPLTLEFFVSLRSPYTAIAWEPTLKLAKDSGVELVVRPVLPMVMRGVPASRAKKIYIATDSYREAKTLNVEFGKFYDPIGEPVLKGYSLYMWSLKQNKGNDFLGAFLKGAFARGINTNSLSGMKKITEMAGLNWNEAKDHLEDSSWGEMLEDNRLAMYEFGSWGVPSYRLSDADGKEILTAWGQDRLWLISKKIRSLN